MAQTLQEFLSRLKKAITTFYTAGHSTDTDLDAVLRTYAGEFASGSQEIENTYNNLHILTANTEKLYDNFGTYFAQPKYFEQDTDDDRYVVGSGSIPSYRKTIDFLLDAAIHGGTIQAVERTVNAFTLVNPEIRELHTIDRWRLKAVSGSISGSVDNVLTITPDPGWKRGELIGSIAIFTSGSGSGAPQDGGKFIVTYFIDDNTQNQITLGLAI